MTEPDRDPHPPFSWETPRKIVPSDEPTTGMTSTSPAAPAPVAWAPGAPSTPQIPGAEGFQFAGVPTRVGAYLLDGLIVSVLSVIALLVLALAVPGMPALVPAVLVLAVDGAYYVGFWRTQRRGTPAMRLVRIQVGHAFDGAVLTMEQAIRRWVALTGPGLLFPILPDAGTALVLLWLLVLLVTTAASPTRQGLHDRFAGSAVATPAGRATGAGAAAVVIVVLVVVVPLIAIAGLILLGGTLSAILETIGECLDNPIACES
jgi:uncharacterized RDD family membrane protein YckC